MMPSSFGPVSMGWEDGLARLAAAIVLGILILELPFLFDDDTMSIDPAKVISGVMSGIGFLGAGALFRDKNIVRGAGSAASIWSAGAIGLMCGMGLLWLSALVAAGIVALFLISRRYADTDRYTNYQDQHRDG